MWHSIAVLGGTLFLCVKAIRTVEVNRYERQLALGVGARKLFSVVSFVYSELISKFYRIIHV